VSALSGYDELEYYIKNYDIEIVANPDRSYDVTEIIDVYFAEESQGIFRNIPLYSSAESYGIKNAYVVGDEYTYSDGFFKIGTPGVYITGDRRYEIHYTLAHWADNEEDYDYLYVDLIGTEWDTYIDRVSARVILPDGAILVDYKLTSGGYGSTGNDYAVSSESGGVITVESVQPLPPYTAITLNARLNEGAFYEAEKWVPELTINKFQTDIKIDKYGQMAVSEKYDVTVNRDGVDFVRTFYQYRSSGEEKIIKNVSVVMPDGSVSKSFGRGPYAHVDFAGKKGTQQSFIINYEVAHNLRENQADALFALELIEGYNECIYENVVITLDAPFDLADVKFSSLYLAKMGSNGPDVEISENTAVISAKNVEVGDIISLQIAISGAKFLRRFRLADVGVPAMFAVIFIIVIALVLTKNERPLTVPIEFYPPYALNPAEMGYIIDDNVSGRDVTSLIYYWASKGYLKIEMREKGKFTLHKLADMASGHKDYEYPMFNSLWQKGFDDQVTSGQLENSFYTTVNEAAGKVRRFFKKERSLYVGSRNFLWAAFAFFIVPGSFLFISVLSAYRGFSIAGEIGASISMGICLFIVPFFIASVYRNQHKGNKRFLAVLNIFVVLVLAFVSSATFVMAYSGRALSYVSSLLSVTVICAAAVMSPVIKKRTEYGTALKERSMGFRQFLLTAEKSRLEMLLKENPDYYYDILPYALVLGVSKIWEGKFDGLLTAPPSWYYGTGVNPMSPGFGMHRAMNAMSKSMTSVPQQQGSSSGSFGGGSSSGGGFSGGGFSGGGSGGGGGGRW